jgi:hypothetical protein
MLLPNFKNIKARRHKPKEGEQIMLKTEREIIYTPNETAESNAVANVFLILLVLALVGFLGYYIAVMMPSANAPSSSTIIQRTTERQIVVPSPGSVNNTVTTTPAPATNSAAPNPATDNSAPENSNP